MQTWLIANPESGSGERNAGFWTSHLREAGLERWGQGDLQDRDWVSAVRSGDLVLAAGGDGFVQLAAALCLERDAVLGVLPSGTANDFARHLQLPPDPADLCRLMREAPIQHVDVSFLNDRLYLNVAHIGLGTLPSREASQRTKRWLGRFSYAASMVSRLWAGRGFHAEIRTDHATLRGRWLSIAIANGIFYGGGNKVPHSAIDDGQLDVVAVRPRSRLKLLFTFLLVGLFRLPPRALSTVVHIKSQWCQVRPRRPKVVTADGEVACYTPLDVYCRSRALRVISPGLVETSR